MNASYFGRSEKDWQCQEFTWAVRLHVLCRNDGEFKFEVYLSQLIRETISQAMIKSVANLRNILGDYIFKAIKIGIKWKEQEKDTIQDFTGILNLSFTDGDTLGDCTLEVILGHDLGWEAYQDLFPQGFEFCYP